MSQVINHDTVQLNDKNAYSIKSYLHNMIFILHNAVALVTATDVAKSSAGLNLTE